MQLHIEYGLITNQIFTAFHQQFKCLNHECQMPIAHSVFKQTVLNVSAHQLQQHTIEICCTSGSAMAEGPRDSLSVEIL